MQVTGQHDANKAINVDVSDGEFVVGRLDSWGYDLGKVVMPT